MLVSTSIRPRKDLVIKLLKQLQDQKKTMQDLKAEHAGTNAEQFEQSLVSSMDQQFGQPTKIRSALVYILMLLLRSRMRQKTLARSKKNVFRFIVDLSCTNFIKFHHALQVPFAVFADCSPRIEQLMLRISENNQLNEKMAVEHEILKKLFGCSIIIE